MKKVEENKKKKQSALLNTAYKLFTKKGYDKTSISDIVGEAGVAKGTFYLYFKDKTDIRYKLIAFKSAQIFEKAYKKYQQQDIPSFEDRLIYLLDQIVEELRKNPLLLQLISKHLGWGIFKNALVEHSDPAQQNIYEIYMKLLQESGKEYKNPEVMIYMIIELIGGSCYNSILHKQPAPIDQLKPYLYDTVKSIIKNNEK